ncbi:MAG: aldehyde dehydrogenase family protein, partial [Steroidobacteraceae bacterium]
MSGTESDINDTLARLELAPLNPGAWSGSQGWTSSREGALLSVLNPATGTLIAQVRPAGVQEYEAVLSSAVETAATWRAVPAPKRGEVIRLIGEELRRAKADLGTLVSLENGKILAEGLGEVQEMIDIADFAVGQSRMLYGLT